MKPTLKIAMDRKLAYSCAMDAANRNMRAEGRLAWDEDDSEAYCEAFNRLWPLTAEYPWLQANPWLLWR